jgi:hypothetical protein
MKTIIYTNTYSGEGLYDFSRDMCEAVDPYYNQKMKDIPTDDGTINGIQEGTFTVTIEWSDDK